MSDPRELGRYQLVRRLGEGGMGVVHLGVARGIHGFEKLVAVKCLHRNLTKDAEQTEALFREAMLGASMSHANVVEVYDLGESEGNYFVVMEYVPGFSLAHVLGFLASEGAPMPVAHAVFVVRSIGRALDHVHRAIGPADERVIHGDVSPSNILLSRDGRIKLTDFGVSGFAAQRDAGDRIAGKLGYLPPEAFAGSAPRQAWDVHALCVTLMMALVSGGETQRVRGLVDRVRAQGARAVLGEGLPGDLVELVDAGLHNRVERRFADAASFIEALDRSYSREVSQPDKFARWIAELYAKKAFVARFGELPRSGMPLRQLEFAPAFAETAMAQPSTSRSLRRRSSILRLGLSPAVGAERARSYGAHLDDTLSQLLDRQVTSTVLGDYRGLVDGLCSGELDLAWMPPLAFVQAWERGAEVLVASVRQTGGESYHGILYVRGDSEVRSLSELSGTRVGWVSRDSASGYVFPAADVIETVGPLTEVFRKQHFFGSHDAVLQAVVNEWVDVGATFASVDRDRALVSAGWEVMGQGTVPLRTIGISTAIPSDNIAHRPHLPESLRDELRSAFKELSSTEEGRMLIGDVFNAVAFDDADIGLYERARALNSLVQGATG